MKIHCNFNVMTTFIPYEIFSSLFVCVYMVCASVIVGIVVCRGWGEIKEEHTGVGSFLPLWDLGIKLVSLDLHYKCYSPVTISPTQGILCYSIYYSSQRENFRASSYMIVFQDVRLITIKANCFTSPYL